PWQSNAHGSITDVHHVVMLPFGLSRGCFRLVAEARHRPEAGVSMLLFPHIELSVGHFPSEMSDHMSTEKPAQAGTVSRRPAGRHASMLLQSENRSMRHWIFCLISISLLTSLGGCTYTTLSHVQFHVPDASGDSARREQVMTVVQDVA